MKKLLTTFTLLSLIACNKKEETKATETTEIPAKTTAADNVKSCYESVKDKDTVSLSLVLNANNVNGVLAYNLYEKDKNDGTISGTFIGDTLYADYTFKSEGQSSVREVVFLRNGDVLTEGHGDMEEKNAKMCFKNPKKVTFDNSGIVLTKAECK